MANEIESRLKEAQEMLIALQFHLQTLDKMIVDEVKKFTSDLVDPQGTPMAINVTACKPEQLQARANYYYYIKEKMSVLAEIRSKENLIAQYKEHYEATLKQESKAISDKEILSAIQEMNNLPLKGKLKQTANDLANDFMAGNVVGLIPRYEYFEAVKNFVKANS
jgi:hypothetical protein